MASFDSGHVPTVFFKKLEDLLDLYLEMIKELYLVGKTGENAGRRESDHSTVAA
jgi:hypothetical protein